MSLKAYTTVTLEQPRGYGGLMFAKEFSKVMKQFFDGIELAMNDHELDSKNDPFSLAVYSVNIEVYSLYNSDKTDILMLQELFEKLEDIRDNEKKELSERAYADVLHTQLTASFVTNEIAAVRYETR